MSNETTATYDPIADAMAAEAKDEIKTVFGEMDVEVWSCIFVQDPDTEKWDLVEFDAINPSHNPLDRLQQITLTLYPTKGNYNTERKFLAQREKSWAKVIKPSMVDLKLDLRNIKGRFVQAMLVPCGSYTDKTTGEKKPRTTFKFLKVYATDEECIADADLFFKGRGHGNGSEAAVPPPAPTQAVKPQMDKATALLFLGSNWNGHKDPAKLLHFLATTPALLEHFGPDSPEVQALIQPTAAIA